MDAADAVAVPVLLAAHVDAKVVAGVNKRDELDTWLNKPIGRKADNEKRLLDHLRG